MKRRNKRTGRGEVWRLERGQEKLTHIPGEDVSAEHTTDDVAQVRNVVDVRQRRRNEIVLVSFYR